MANVNFEDKTQPKGTIREASDRFSREVQDKASEVFNSAADTASEFYDQASHWLERNFTGKNIGIVALLATVGVVGFMLGRSGRESKSSMMDMKKY